MARHSGSQENILNSVQNMHVSPPNARIIRHFDNYGDLEASATPGSGKSNDLDKALTCVFRKCSLSDVHKRIALVSERWCQITRDPIFGPKQLVLGHSLRNVGALKNFPNSIEHLIFKCYYYRDRKQAELEEIISMAKKCEKIRKLTFASCILPENLWIILAPLSVLKRSLSSFEYIQFDGTIVPHERRFAELKQILFFVAYSNIVNLTLSLFEDYDRYISFDIWPKSTRKLRLTVLTSKFNYEIKVAENLIRFNKNGLTHVSLKCDYYRELDCALKDCKRLKYIALTALNCDVLFGLSPLKCDTLKIKPLLLKKNFEIDEFRYFENATHAMFGVAQYKDDREYSWLNDARLNFPLLVKVSLYCEHEKDKGCVFTENIALKIAAKFPRLEKLEIKGICKKLNYATLKDAVVSNFPDLSELEIYGRGVKGVPTA